MYGPTVQLLFLVWVAGVVAGIWTGAKYRELSPVLGAVIGLSIGFGCMVAAGIGSRLMPDFFILWLLGGIGFSVMTTAYAVKRSPVKSIEDD